MSSPITGINTLPPPIQQWFDNVLLSRPMTNLIYKTFALKKQLPSRSGRTVRFRRYNNLQTATVPLPASGLTPPPQAVTAVDIDATISFYGDYTLITDQVTFLNQDPVLNEQASLLAQAMRETEDELVRNMLASTASQINCVNGGGTDNPTPLSGTDLDQAIVALINSRSMMISDHIEGSLKFGTAPVRDSFWAMMHSNLIPDLEGISGFVSMAQYPAAMNILNYEWGSYKNLRFLYTSGGSVSPNASLNGEDVYNTFIVGKPLADVKFSLIDLEACDLLEAA